MNRRGVLAAVASFSVTAGCSGLISSGSNEDNPSDGGNPSNGGKSSAGGDSSNAGSVVAVVDGCPLPKEAGLEQAICNEKQSDSEVFLFTRQNTVSLPRGSIDFVFRNQTAGSVLYAPCRWVVYKRTNQRWRTVRPLKGESNDFDILRSFVTLTLHIGREPSTQTGSCVYFLDELDPGQYLFGVQGTIPDTEDNAGETLFLAPFQAEA